MLRKLISIVLLGFSLIFLGNIPSQAAELINGDFESLTSENKLASWYIDAWKPNSQLALITRKKYQGQYVFFIRSDQTNDARVIQEISVVPNTVYRFSGYIATEGVTGGLGANLSILGENIHSQGLKGSNEWRYEELVFRTGAYQTKLVLAVRLGFYNQISKGKAYFDSLKLEAVTDSNLTYQQATGSAEEPVDFIGLQQPMVDNSSMLGGESNSVFLKQFRIALNLLFYLFLLGWLWVKSSNWSKVGVAKPKNFELRLFLLTILGLIIFLQIGLMKPIVVKPEILSLIPEIISLLLYLGAGWLIFESLLKKRPGLAWYLGAVSICLPVTLFSSTLGDYQTAAATFLVILSFYLIIKEISILAMLAAVTSIIFSPLGVIATLLVLIYNLKQHKLKDSLIGVAGGLLLSIFLLFILSQEQPGVWLGKLYGSLFVATNDTGTGNFIRFLIDNSNSASMMKYFYIFTTLIAGYFVWWGSCYFWRKSYRELLPVIFFFIALACCYFIPGVTPPMLLIPLMSLIMAVGFLKDRQLYLGMIIFSLTCYFNLYSINENYDFLPRVLYILAIVNGCLLMACASYLSIYRKQGRSGKQVWSNYLTKLHEVSFAKLNAVPFTLEKRDYLILTLLTLLATIIIFAQLGSWNTPQKGLEFKEPVEVVFATPVNISNFVIYDGAESGQLQLEIPDANGNWTQALVVSCNDFYVLKRQACNLNQVTHLRIFPQGTAGFINEIAFLDPNEQLIPVKAVLDPQTKQELPPATSPLFNEQAQMLEIPSHLNSTYFDEIYHGRTAYEFIRRSTVYETTHPPLGKDLLSLGILWFGMNPFGMRFMSALSGVLLMLALFLLGREVLKTRFGAYLVMLFGIIAFMPLVQCRYSTIDTFSVLFITLMFFFTFKYFRLQETKERGWDLPVLAGIFLNFALAMATKWTGAYGFAGVVACLGILKLRQYLAWRKLKKATTAQLKSGKSSKTKATVSKTIKSFWLTNFFPFVGIAVATFMVIVPLTYYLSYIPFLRCQGITETFSARATQAVVQSQKDMYSYHADLRATHPYGSSWWSWPFNFKPLWVYTASIKENHNGKIVQLKGTTASFGNPAIWILALLGLIMLLYQILTTRKFSLMYLVLVGFLAQYLPWVLIARVTFIYHFYPCLPFFLLFAAWALEGCWRMGKDGTRATYIYLGICIGLFVLFYPAISGMAVPEFYINNFLRWFPQDWMF